MKIEKLQIGKKYFIDFNKKTNPGFSPECYYTGPGILVKINPDGYDPNTVEVLGDDGDTGYYSPEDIAYEIKLEKNHIWVIEFFDGDEWNLWNSVYYLTRQDARVYKCIHKNRYPCYKFRVTKYISEK
ncbi:MAG: hypothetical protein PHW03_02645 [Eubacteriales bacterium]|nr:hypothetical protein [Eubacteriales bacterium]